MNESVKLRIDLRDLHLIKKYKYNLTTPNKTPRYLYRISPEKRMISLHREIIKAPKGSLVDHINGNVFDVRRSNLRLASYRQNSCNRSKHRAASSKYLGVGFHKAAGKWRVRIRDGAKRLEVGHYNCEIQAARAYNEAALKYHGEFARLNVIN